MNHRIINVGSLISPSPTFLFLIYCPFLFPQKYPPYISSSIPFLGHAVAFGKSPIEFLENAYDKVPLDEHLLKIFNIAVKYLIQPILDWGLQRRL